VSALLASPATSPVEACAQPTMTTIIALDHTAIRARRKL
jgi:hypothetical protein